MQWSEKWDVTRLPRKWCSQRAVILFHWVISIRSPNAALCIPSTGIKRSINQLVSMQPGAQTHAHHLSTWNDRKRGAQVNASNDGVSRPPQGVSHLASARHAPSSRWYAHGRRTSVTQGSDSSRFLPCMQSISTMQVFTGRDDGVVPAWPENGMHGGIGKTARRRMSPVKLPTQAQTPVVGSARMQGMDAPTWLLRFIRLTCPSSIRCCETNTVHRPICRQEFRQGDLPNLFILQQLLEIRSTPAAGATHAISGYRILGV